MNQSTIIFGYLVAAFLVFIIAKGEISTYLAFFGIGSAASSGSTGTQLATLAGGQVGGQLASGTFNAQTASTDAFSAAKLFAA